MGKALKNILIHALEKSIRELTKRYPTLDRSYFTTRENLAGGSVVLYKDVIIWHSEQNLNRLETGILQLSVNRYHLTGIHVRQCCKIRKTKNILTFNI